MLAEGEFALVWDYLEAVKSKPVSARGLLFHDNEVYALSVDMAVLQRDRVSLRQYAPLAEETAVRDGHILYQASAHRAWGVLHRLDGKYAEAEARLNQALELFQGLDARWQVGRTLYELAELAHSQSDPTTARDQYSLALTAFEKMSAIPDVARTQAALESVGPG